MYTIGMWNKVNECNKSEPARSLKKYKVTKGAKIMNRYNQVPHLTEDTNGKVAKSQVDIRNESQEVSPYPAGYHKGQLNRRTQRHNKHKTEKHK